MTFSPFPLLFPVSLLYELCTNASFLFLKLVIGPPSTFMMGYSEGGETTPTCIGNRKKRTVCRNVVGYEMGVTYCKKINWERFVLNKSFLSCKWLYKNGSYRTSHTYLARRVWEGLLSITVLPLQIMTLNYPDLWAEKLSKDFFLHIVHSTMLLSFQRTGYPVISSPPHCLKWSTFKGAPGTLKRVVSSCCHIIVKTRSFITDARWGW